jgi:hypothetical protein
MGRIVHDSALGFRVTPEYAAGLQAMRQLAAQWDRRDIPPDRRLLSVYTSPLDIVAGVESPTPVGSLIHALGPDNRARFTGLVETRAVAAVTTIAPDYSGWEGWNLRANWPFFRVLRENYTPVARSEQNILWIAGGGEGPVADAACRVTPHGRDGFDVAIEAPRAGLASVRLEREAFGTAGRTALLTVIEESPMTREASKAAWKDFPRYGIANEPTVFVPAPVRPGAVTRLTFTVMDGSDIGSARCHARVYEEIDVTALPPLAQGIGHYLAGTRP